MIRTVRELIDAGAAGCFLEDQQWPKKCGHMRGKRVIEREEYLDKIRAAVDTRGDADFFIVARTDSLAVLGLDEAIARVTEARAVGADASFVEAPNSLDEMAEIGRRAPGPVVANMIEKGKTPVLPKAEARRARLPPHSLSARRPVRRRPRPGGDLRKNPTRRHDARRRKPADGVRRIQRPHRRRIEIQDRRTLRREVDAEESHRRGSKTRGTLIADDQ